MRSAKEREMYRVGEGRKASGREKVQGRRAFPGVGSGGAGERAGRGASEAARSGGKGHDWERGGCRRRGQRRNKGNTNNPTTPGKCRMQTLRDTGKPNPGEERGGVRPAAQEKAGPGQ